MLLLVRAGPVTTPASQWHTSLCRTAPAPGGTAAPVAISTAVPGASAPGCGGPPASTCPITFHGPAPATAKPSIAEVSKPGNATIAGTCAARTLPIASRTGTG